MARERFTPKEEGFCQDIANKKYQWHWEAYAAHYNISNTKKMTTVHVKANELLSKPKIQARIAEIEAKIREQEKLTLDEVIVRLGKRNEVTAKDYIDDDGSFKKMSELTDDQAVFITGFKVQEIWGRGNDKGTQTGRIVDVKIESFKDIMDMLIRNHGGYAKDKETGSSDLDAIRDIINSIKQ